MDFAGSMNSENFTALNKDRDEEMPGLNVNRRYIAIISVIMSFMHSNWQDDKFRGTINTSMLLSLYASNIIRV